MPSANRLVTAALAMLLQLLFHVPVFAAEAETAAADKASPTFTLIALGVMVVLIVAPLIWWAIREKKGGGKD